MKQLGQYPRAGHVIAHLSDPHLLAGGRLQYGAIDTEARLERALARLSVIDPPPQALVFTGDLADRAEPKRQLPRAELKREGAVRRRRRSRVVSQSTPE